MMASPKRKTLTLEEKLKAIAELDKGRPAYKVAGDFGVRKTQIQSLRKRKKDVLNDAENCVNMQARRKIHFTGNEDINRLTSLNDP